MKKKLLFVLSALLVLASAFLWLVWRGEIRFNHPSPEKYPVRGVDVSAYQGEIDWDVLAAQGISFAFIKATEGSAFVDPRFAENFAAARKTPLRVGAYHFFSFDSSGQAQAENFISAVPVISGGLPPVVDVELYGEHRSHPPAAEAVRAELDALLTRLEAAYGVKPILYATQSAYRRYLDGAYDDYDLWIRSVYFPPALPHDRPWTFWQYTDKARLNGYRGEEECIDMNVFCGTEEDFLRKYALHS